jgi:hypothetical protein
MEDILKRLNFNPSSWGNQTWDILGKIALSYPMKPTEYERIKYK